MSPEKEDPADLMIQVFWAIAGLFALMIAGGAIVAISNSMKPGNQLTPIDRQIESPVLTPSPSLTPGPKSKS
jgi:hypothetical protein